MNRLIILIVAGILLTAAADAAEPAQSSLAITRLDCGTVQVNDLNVFSDTDAYRGQAKTLVDSCYLLRHGDDYMLWDTGLPASLKGAALTAEGPISASVSKTLLEQLAVLGIDAKRITIVGISHYHFDHIGQLPDFTHAKLLIGRGDWEAVTAAQPAPDINPAPFRSWIDGDAANVEIVTGDRDIYGDGQVLMLAMPGHTPGHSSLLVRLADKGPLLLTGDLAHFTANYRNDGVPTFNTDRADTLASLQRFKGLAKNNRAVVIIQHEPDDVAKLPAFPAFAD
jgi:glyoxylase-like metal-dependent hydrolase (beta-lactamase superfamily II)